LYEEDDDGGMPLLLIQSYFVHYAATGWIKHFGVDGQILIDLMVVSFSFCFFQNTV
jgi:hypothetical protein